MCCFPVLLLGSLDTTLRHRAALSSTNIDRDCSRIWVLMFDVSWKVHGHNRRGVPASQVISASLFGRQKHAALPGAPANTIDINCHR